MYRFFAGQYAEAWKISKQLDELLVFVPGMMTVVEHAFFQCLSVSALWTAGTAAERAELRGLHRNAAALARNLGDALRRELAPLSLTVGAELRSHPWRMPRGRELYERAMAAARDSRFPHIEAIAAELAMKHGGHRSGARECARRAPSPRTAPGARCARPKSRVSSARRILMLRNVTASP